MVDTASVAVAMFVAAFLRFGWTTGAEYVNARSLELLVPWAVFPPVFYVSGLYDTRRLRNAAAVVLPALLSIGAGVLLSGACIYTAGSLTVGRGVVSVFAAALFAALIASRMLYVRAARRGLLSARCLVIGSDEQVNRVVRLVRRHPEAGLTIVGTVRCHDDGSTGQDILDALPSLGTLDSLERIVAEERIDRVILGTSIEEEPVLLRRLRPIRYRGVAIVEFVSLYEELAREIPIDEIDDEWLLKASTMSSPLHIRRFKRATDIVVSLLLLPPSLLVLAFAAVAIKLTSRGPVLFRQERVGLGSRSFMVLKLRTMTEDAEKGTGPVWSTENDPRITPVGAFLRKFRIDELPQLFNVLRGDMSLVGPRPERPPFVQKLAETVPFYAERLLVRPGVTGWAQVMAPYAATVGDSIRKLQFDLYYVKNLSFSLDLLILIKTVRTVLFGRERVQGGMTAGQLLATVAEPTCLGAPVSANDPGSRLPLTAASEAAPLPLVAKLG